MEWTRHTSAVCTARGSLVLSLMHQTQSNPPLIRSNPASLRWTNGSNSETWTLKWIFPPASVFANLFYTISKEPRQYLQTSSTRRENYNVTASALIHEADSRTHLFADTRILEPFEQQVLTDSVKLQTAKPIRQDMVQWKWKVRLLNKWSLLRAIEKINGRIEKPLFSPDTYYPNSVR